MDNKKQLKLNMDELGSAMEDGSYEHDYYLDLETGEIVFLSEYTDDEENEGFKKRIEDEPDRYEIIPKAESREGYHDMQDFIATINDDHIAEVLDTAIQGSGAFRRFKDALLRYPEERERWFKFKNERTHERALEWLNDIGVSVSEE